METLKHIRFENNLTQKEMADKLGFSLSYYQKVEAGFKRPSFNFIYKLKENYPDISSEIFF